MLNSQHFVRLNYLSLVASLFLIAGISIAAHAEDASHILGIQSQRTDLTLTDRKRVEKITTPTSDFSKAERFENMQGGTSTSKKLVNKHAFRSLLQISVLLNNRSLRLAMRYLKSSGCLRHHRHRRRTD